jgi:hypothetical protein
MDRPLLKYAKEFCPVWDHFIMPLWERFKSPEHQKKQKWKQLAKANEYGGNIFPALK